MNDKVFLYHPTIKKLISKDTNQFKFIEEDDMGNIEYKLRLDSKSQLGLKKLASQMKWRMSQGYEQYGRYESHYILGIHDDGELGKMSDEMITATYDVFKNIVMSCDATIVEELKYSIQDSSIMYIMINKKKASKIKEMSCVFVGPSGCGKTTLISSLAYGICDNGNGSARKLIFKYPHEKETGQTSSIKKEIIGLKNDRLVNFSSCVQTQWDHIVDISDAIVNLIDIPGNKKFSKTIYFGLLSHKIDIMMIIIDATQIDHLDTLTEIKFYSGLGKLMDVHIIIVATKVDLMINTNNNINSLYDIPIIYVTNITGSGYEKLIEYFYNKIVSCDFSYKESDYNFFTVVDTYNIPETGIVLSGIVNCGSFKLGDEVYVQNETNCIKTVIKSIHKKQIDSSIIYEGESGCLRLLCDNINRHTIVSKNICLAYTSFIVMSCSDMGVINKLNELNNQKCIIYIGNMTACATLNESDNILTIKTTTPIIIQPFNDKIIGIIKTDSEFVFYGNIKPCDS